MKNSSVLVLLGCLGMAGCGNAAGDIKAQAWEHGWKTEHVIATRYKNPTMGHNIGFTYPGREGECDRSELVEFMSKHEGWVYQCGGSPGAEMFVKFKDVTDKPTADAKLVQLLPPLEKLVSSLR